MWFPLADTDVRIDDSRLCTCLALSVQINIPDVAIYRVDFLYAPDAGRWAGRWALAKAGQDADRTSWTVTLKKLPGLMKLKPN